MWVLVGFWLRELTNAVPSPYRNLINWVNFPLSIWPDKIIVCRIPRQNLCSYPIDNKYADETSACSDGVIEMLWINETNKKVNARSLVFDARRVFFIDTPFRTYIQGIPADLIYLRE